MESFRYRATFLFYQSPIFIVLVDRLEDDDILLNKTSAGYFLTTIGVLGIFTSFVIQKSEFDPTALALAIAAIFVAIMGITLILQPPNGKRPTKTRRKQTSSNKFKRASYLVRAI